jgi:hypothetical protein
MRLIDADELKKDNDVVVWLSRNTVRAGKMIKAFSELFIKKINDTPTVNAIPIPENATNGDMIKAMFPNIEIEEIDDELIVAYKLDVKGTPFYRVWWNAPYKELNNEK